jgi:hypothetical protein
VPAPPAFTEPSRPVAVSADVLDGSRTRIRDMDVVAVILGLAMFALLIGLIYAIDRV